MCIVCTVLYCIVLYYIPPIQGIVFIVCNVYCLFCIGTILYTASTCCVSKLCKSCVVFALLPVQCIMCIS